MRPPQITCAWYHRWLHRRLRQADIDTMWTMLNATGSGPRAIQAWRRFTQDRGQEHWRCPCAHRDPTTYRMMPRVVQAEGMPHEAD